MFIYAIRSWRCPLIPTYLWPSWPSTSNSNGFSTVASGKKQNKKYTLERKLFSASFHPTGWRQAGNTKTTSNIHLSSRATRREIQQKKTSVSLNIPNLRNNKKIGTDISVCVCACCLDITYERLTVSRDDKRNLGQGKWVRSKNISVEVNVISPPRWIISKCLIHKDGRLLVRLSGRGKTKNADVTSFKQTNSNKMDDWNVPFFFYLFYWKRNDVRSKKEKSPGGDRWKKEKKKKKTKCARAGGCGLAWQRAATFYYTVLCVYMLVWETFSEKSNWKGVKTKAVTRTDLSKFIKTSWHWIH